MENEFNGKHGTVKYFWDGGVEYASEGTVFFSPAGVFLKDSDDESFAGLTVFFPYARIIRVTF